MADEMNKNSHMFLSLVTSMHVGAMYQLGKVASPISGKVERDLRQAQYTIDLLGMLAEKTSGNLSDEEAKFLQRVLSELRMNYLDEAKKPDPEESDSDDSDATDDQKDSEDVENKSE